MNKDIIYRQAVIDLLKQMRKDGDMVPWEGKDVFARIRKLPSAQPDSKDLIEERKGEWEQIEVSYFADMDDETKTGMAIASMFCPRCKRYHNEVYLYGNPTFGVNFCPNCGADMREQP